MWWKRAGGKIMKVCYIYLYRYIDKTSPGAKKDWLQRPKATKITKGSTE